MDEPPIFRAVKRRKYLHKQDCPEPATKLDEEEMPTQLIKSRSLPRARLKGVQFSNQKTSINESDNTDLVPTTAAISQASEPNTSYGINNRFIGSTTGQVVNVDKHMMAYVDQQMAKKHLPTSSVFSQQHADSQSHDNDDDDEASSSTSRSDSASPAPPTQRHNVSSSTSSFQPLAEVDLSAHTTTNPTNTTATPKPSRQKRPRRPRLGRDGKPFRPRARKRRDSVDIARDGLVEQVLHETGGASAGANTSASVTREARQGNNEALDEKMASEFQRQFLDAISERRQMQQHRSNNSAKAGGGSATNTQQHQGPRLGGSRSARARVHAAAQAAAAAADGRDGKDGEKIAGSVK